MEWVFRSKLFRSKYKEVTIRSKYTDKRQTVSTDPLILNQKKIDNVNVMYRFLSEEDIIFLDVM